jgi:hypothetical protein
MGVFQPWNGWNAASYMPSEGPVGAELARDSGISVEFNGD